MRRFMDILNEGSDPRSNHPAFTPDEPEKAGDEHLDWTEILQRHIHDSIVGPVKRQQAIHKVYDLCLDGIGFEDAVRMVSKRDGMPSDSQFRAAVIADYKNLRANPDTYSDDVGGHELVSTINAEIHESLDRAIMESYEFHPSVMRKEMHDGAEHTVIDYAGGGIGRRMEPCFICHGEMPKMADCGYCKGKGEAEEEFTNCPTLRMSYMNLDLLCDMLGMEPEAHGWIPPEQVADLKARIVDKMTQRDKSQFTKPASDTQRPASLSWDGEAKSAGPRMIGGAQTPEMADKRFDRILEIVNWALQHGSGLSWA